MGESGREARNRKETGMRFGLVGLLAVTVLLPLRWPRRRSLADVGYVEIGQIHFEVLFDALDKLNLCELPSEAYKEAELRSAVIDLLHAGLIRVERGQDDLPLAEAEAAANDHALWHPTTDSIEYVIVPTEAGKELYLEIWPRFLRNRKRRMEIWPGSGASSAPS